MSPEERQLLTDLFERVRGASATPRDRDAEDLIAQKLREQPYATYFLAQAVIVQDHALQATTDRLRELEDEVDRLQAAAQGPGQQQSGGFLGGLTSLFGGSQQSPNQPVRDAASQREGRLYDNYAQVNREPEPAPGPWGRAGASGPWSQQAAAPSPGGGFLHGALTAAAGVAGGVLVADAVRGLFSSHMGGANANPLAGFGNFGGTPVEQTTVNNYFLDDDKQSNRDNIQQASNSSDNTNDDDDFDTADFGGDDDSSFA